MSNKNPQHDKVQSRVAKFHQTARHTENKPHRMERKKKRNANAKKNQQQVKQKLHKVKVVPVVHVRTHTHAANDFH